MNGTQVVGRVNLESPGLDWQIQGTGDFNQDGKTDILWRHQGGQVHTWLMNGTQVVGRVNLESPGLDWQIQGKNGYYRELSSLTENDWDVQSGDNNQFEANPLGGGGDQRWKTDDRIEQIYTDLSTSIFGSRRQMNAGYAFDTSYLSLKAGYHSGIDIQASGTDTIKAAVNGVVAIAPYAEWLDRDKNGTKEFFNGWWMAIDETDSSGAKTGRRWWYGHMKQPTTTFKPGTSVIGGQTVLAKGDSLFAHLHLAVQNVKGGVGNGYSALDVQNRTISPLHAYWKAKNSIKESVIWS
jgi:murein DD-endopeptidase MepM/ murein hydrolase activator NlpD